MGQFLDLALASNEGKFEVCVHDMTFKVNCMRVNLKLEWLSRDNLSSPLIALVTYGHVKN